MEFHSSRRHSQARQPPPLLQTEQAPPLKKGPWTAEEDALLLAYVSQHGNSNWNFVQKYSGVSRCGKSCRLRWTNHLRPHLKKCSFSREEERIIIEQHAAIGNRWSRIAAMLPGRTDNEVKNFWNTRVKRLLRAGRPLYPPDITPVAQARPQRQESEHSTGERTVSTYLRGDGPTEQSTVASSLNSMPISTQNQESSSPKAGTCHFEVASKISQASLGVGGPSTGSIKDVDGSGFLLRNVDNIVCTRTFENISPGLRCAEQISLNCVLQNETGQPFYHFSSGNMCSELERRASSMYDPKFARSTSVYQVFPFNPEPPDRRRSMYDLSRVDANMGTGFDGISRSKQSTTPPIFNSSTSMDDAPSFKVELPSVQLAESADSSSSLTSPFSGSQSLPFSEVDSFGSTSNECSTINSGRILDLIFQQKASSPHLLSADMVEQLLAGNSDNVFFKRNEPASFLNSTRMVSNDPLSFLGGRSLTLFNDDLKNTPAKSVSNEAPFLITEMLAGRDDPNEQVLPVLNMKIEDHSTVPYADGELDTLLAFERSDGYPVVDLYNEIDDSGTLGDYQEVGYLEGSEAVYGQNASLDLEQLAAISGGSIMWELGSCPWSSMPGAF